MNIYTIGHSTRSIEDFCALLEENKIDLLCDIRSYPSSKYCPQFNRDELQRELFSRYINYEWIVRLGGRRKVKPDSRHDAWRHKSFRAYADHMESTEFGIGLAWLERQARAHTIAYMCAEALWTKCHRMLVSDALTAAGWQVEHIMGPKRVEPHKTIVGYEINPDGSLLYRANCDLLQHSQDHMDSLS